MNLIGPDARKLSRWCFLGAIVMLIWLLIPVGRCSVAVFRDEPLSTIDGAVPADADKQRVEVGKGFFHTLTHGVKSCYELTPLFGQEDWKSGLLVGFASISVLAWAFTRLRPPARPR